MEADDRSHHMGAVVSVVIVGGGVTGLAAAYYLQRAAGQEDWHLELFLVEAEGRLGGKVLTDGHEGFIIEGGPDSFLASKPWAVELAKELGLGDRLVAPEAGRVYLLHQEKLHPIPQALLGPAPGQALALWRAPFLSRRGKARASLEPLIPRRRDCADESLGRFLRRRLGREWAERLGQPLLGGIHAGDAERLSVQALYPTLAGWERQHGSLARGLQKARADHGTPQRMSPFLSLKDGMASLPTALARFLDTRRCIVNRRVTGLSKASGQDRPPFRVSLDNGDRLEATFVVLTTPAYATAPMLRDLAPEAADLLAQLPYASTASVTLAFQQGAVRRPLDGSGFLAPRKGAFPLSACTWSSSKWPGRAPRGFVLLRAFVGSAGDDRWLEKDNADLIEAATEALRPLLAITGRPERAWVHRWHRAMPQYEVGHLDWVAAVDRSLASYPALVLAGSAYRGVGVPDCIRQGREAAERVRKLAATEIQAPHLHGFFTPGSAES